MLRETTTTTVKTFSLSLGEIETLILAGLAESELHLEYTHAHFQWANNDNGEELYQLVLNLTNVETTIEAD